MVENLNYAGADSSDSNYVYCYDDEKSNCDRYGRLYGNLYAEGNVEAICPEGWHVPSVDEWKILIENVGGSGFAAKRLKCLAERRLVHGASGCTKRIWLRRLAKSWKSLQNTLRCFLISQHLFLLFWGVRLGIVF